VRSALLDAVGRELPPQSRQVKSKQASRPPPPRSQTCMALPPHSRVESSHKFKADQPHLKRVWPSLRSRVESSHKFKADQPHLKRVWPSRLSRVESSHTSKQTSPISNVYGPPAAQSSRVKSHVKADQPNLKRVWPFLRSERLLEGQRSDLVETRSDRPLVELCRAHTSTRTRTARPWARPASRPAVVVDRASERVL
jgi:hypothetical protein